MRYSIVTGILSALRKDSRSELADLLDRSNIVVAVETLKGIDAYLESHDDELPVALSDLLYKLIEKKNRISDTKEQERRHSNLYHLFSAGGPAGNRPGPADRSDSGNRPRHSHKENQVIVSRDSYCLFCATSTRKNHCWANNYGNGVRYELPDYEVRPALSVQEYTLFWNGVEDGASRNYEWAHVLKKLKQYARESSFLSFPDELDFVFKELDLPSVPAFRSALSEAAKNCLFEQERYVLNSSIVQVGIIELDKWFEYFAPSVCGKIAQSLAFDFQKYAEGDKKAIIARASAHFSRSRYLSDTLILALVETVRDLVVEELQHEPRYRRKAPAVLQEVLSKLRRSTNRAEMYLILRPIRKTAPKTLDVFQTTPEYVDCDCSRNYIHRVADLNDKSDDAVICRYCHTRKDEAPDSRVNEILDAGFSIADPEKIETH